MKVWYFIDKKTTTMGFWIPSSSFKYKYKLLFKRHLKELGMPKGKNAKLSVNLPFFVCEFEFEFEFEIENLAPTCLCLQYHVHCIQLC